MPSRSFWFAVGFKTLCALRIVRFSQGCAGLRRFFFLVGLLVRCWLLPRLRLRWLPFGCRLPRLLRVAWVTRIFTLLLVTFWLDRLSTFCYVRITVLQFKYLRLCYGSLHKFCTPFHTFYRSIFTVYTPLRFIHFTVVCCFGSHTTTLLVTHVTRLVAHFFGCVHTHTAHTFALPVWFTVLRLHHNFAARLLGWLVPGPHHIHHLTTPHRTRGFTHLSRGSPRLHALTSFFSRRSRFAHCAQTAADGLRHGFTRLHNSFAGRALGTLTYMLPSFSRFTGWFTFRTALAAYRTHALRSRFWFVCVAARFTTTLYAFAYCVHVYTAFFGWISFTVRLLHGFRSRFSWFVHFALCVTFSIFARAPRTYVRFVWFYTPTRASLGSLRGWLYRISRLRFATTHVAVW